MKKEHSTIANIFFNSFGTIFYYGCQWLTTILIVHLSGYEDTGNYSLAMTFTAAFAVFALFNTRQFQVSDVKAEYKNHTYIYSRYIAIAAALVICGVGLLFNQYTLYQSQVVMLYMIFKCGEALIDVYHGIDQKSGRMDYVCYSYSIRGVLMLASFCGLLITTHSLVFAILGMTVTTYGVALFYDIPIAKRLMGEKEKVNLTKVKELLLLLWPLSMVAVTNNFSISLPRYFLEKFYDATVLGYFSSVATPAIILQVGAATIFVPLITPLASRLAANDREGFVNILKKVSAVLVVLMLFTIIASALLGSWFLELMFGAEIAPYTYLFVPIILSTLLIAINACLFPVCTIIREIKGQLLVGVVGMTSSLIFSLFFVKQFSMDGVVMALIGTLVLQILIESVYIYRFMKRWKDTQHG